MQLQTVEFKFTLLTPCFSGTALGKEDDHAEMRVPPIRGHIRFWHRVLFGANDCNRVWGSTSGNEGHGSRVALRIAGEAMRSSTQARLLPHANPNAKDRQEQRKAKSQGFALPPSNQYVLELLRLVGCTNEHWDHAQRAVKLWLLLGGLGLRSNRAAGSVWPIGEWVPKTDKDLKEILDRLRPHYAVALIGEGKGKNPAELSETELRETASDTIQNNPPGDIFGGIKPRIPSPTKFKVIRLGEAHCLLACAPEQKTLQEAERLLGDKPNPARWQKLGVWKHLYP